MQNLRLAFALLFLLAGVAAAAPDVVSAWVRQLEREGYSEIEVTRTWLGRIRISAEKGDIEREIILNRETGEVLRDYSRSDDGELRLPFGWGDDDDAGGSDDDDDGDDDGDDDDDDD